MTVIFSNDSSIAIEILFLKFKKTPNSVCNISNMT